MARRYKLPHCVAELPGGRVCGHEMRPLGERHPYNNHYKADTMWAFQCGYCGAAQLLQKSKLDRYVLPA